LESSHLERSIVISLKTHRRSLCKGYNCKNCWFEIGALKENDNSSMLSLLNFKVPLVSNSIWYFRKSSFLNHHFEDAYNVYCYVSKYWFSFRNMFCKHSILQEWANIFLLGQVVAHFGQFFNPIVAFHSYFPPSSQNFPIGSSKKSKNMVLPWLKSLGIVIKSKQSIVIALIVRYIFQITCYAYYLFP
jgi:hypothetical protein